MQINLKRLLKKKEIVSLLQDIIEPSAHIAITDSSGRHLIGEKIATMQVAVPVLWEGREIALVKGEHQQASLVASLLSYAVAQEVEKKYLGKETLEKYKEINLLYEITEKLTALMHPSEVARAIIDEIKNLIVADHIAVFVYAEEAGNLRPLATWGKMCGSESNITYPGKGIIEAVARGGKGEIINETAGDRRYTPGEIIISSVICVPLKIKEKTSGAVFVGTEKSHSYTAGDLKLLSALAFQGASALENIRLFDNVVREQEEKKQVTRLFGRYVAAQVVEEILSVGEQNLKLGGHRREITVLFVDIRQFTRIVELLGPEEIVELLNHFFEIVTRCIFENQGTIDKFIGDAVMAFFNAPLPLEDHAKRAVQAARQIMLEIAELRKVAREKWRIELQPGIGINIGEAVVGNIGTENRMDYTAIGDTVNLAQRLESIAGPGEVLISEEVYRYVQGKFPTVPLGKKSIKGKERPVMVYKLQ